jgi:hypothetical protein
MDFAGRVLQEIFYAEAKWENSYQFTFDESAYSNGMYMLTLSTTSGEVVTRKLIISR